MEESTVIEHIEELKRGSRSAVYNTLSTIRKEVIATEPGIKLFRTNGGLSHLIFLLHKPNERITDIVLSILANCCMYLECAQEVEKLHGIRYVIHIIKNIAKDSILCRGCRVIGNIAQHETLVESVHQYGTATAISSLLDASETPEPNLSSPTKLMAVRALRLLWTNPLRQQHMLSHNIPKTVSSVLVNHKDSWKERQPDKELLIGVLRCILHFTETPSHDLVQQIIAGGNGFQAIVSLIPLQPYIAVKCVTNLATVATARSQLSTSEATDILIERLTACMETNPGCTWPREELSALCLLCRHAATRDEVRAKNGLSILLSVVKDSSNKDQQGQVLHALLYFIYDETSLQILVSEGLVAILINCFSQLLLEMKCHHDINPKRAGAASNKRELDRPSSKRLLKKKSPSLKRSHDVDLDESSNDFKRFHRSEDSSSPSLFDARLSSPSSSCYSPSSSPLRYSNGDSDSDDSVRYSPVCSESESEDEKSNSELKFANFENEDFVHYEMGSNELENALEEETRPKIGEAPTLSWLLVLLSRTLYMEDVDTRLAHADTIDILLRYMQMSSYPVTRAARILFRIISRWEFLMILLRYNSVMKIYKLLHNLPHGDVCTQCSELKKFLQMIFSKLTCIAESGYGKGQIAHSLLRDEEITIKNIIVTLPFLIQSKNLIRSFFNSCRGLKKLLSIIADRPNDIWNDAVNSLGMLATKLRIKDPLSTETFREIHKISCDYYVNLENKETITFELDDQNRIEADKNTLIQQSPFFKALLEGNRFKESFEDIIHLGDVTKNGFIYLLNLLDYSGKEEDSFPLCVSLSVALEVLVLADRYLLEELTDLLTRAILKNYLKSSTVAEVYKWSLQSSTDILRVESIAFGLVGDMSDDDRINIFNDIMADGFSDHFLKDCRFLLHRHLNIV